MPNWDNESETPRAVHALHSFGKREQVITDYWEGRITQLRADEMLRNLDYQDAVVRCAVCGGPNADGSGCEFCPQGKSPWRA